MNYRYLKKIINIMVIEKIDNKKIVMTFENKIDAFNIQSLIDFARYLDATALSQAKQSDVDVLADEFNSGRWSKMIRPEEEDAEITPLVKNLCGVMVLSQDIDYKTEYGNHLVQKYQ